MALACSPCAIMAGRRVNPAWGCMGIMLESGLISRRWGCQDQWTEGPKHQGSSVAAALIQGSGGTTCHALAEVSVPGARSRGSRHCQQRSGLAQTWGA